MKTAGNTVSETLPGQQLCHRDCQKVGVSGPTRPT